MLGPGLNGGVRSWRTTASTDIALHLWSKRECWMNDSSVNIEVSKLDFLGTKSVLKSEEWKSHQLEFLLAHASLGAQHWSHMPEQAVKIQQESQLILARKGRISVSSAWAGCAYRGPSKGRAHTPSRSWCWALSCHLWWQEVREQAQTLSHSSKRFGSCHRQWPPMLPQSICVMPCNSAPCRAQK